MQKGPKVNAHIASASPSKVHAENASAKLPIETGAVTSVSNLTKQFIHTPTIPLPLESGPKIQLQKTNHHRHPIT